MILIFAPILRTGSTDLLRYIGKSCKLNYLMEPFHPNNKNKYTLEQIQSYDLVKSLGWQQTYDKNIQLIQASNNVIFLTRNSIIDTILSIYASNTYGGIWNKEELKYVNDFHTKIRPPMTKKYFTDSYLYIKKTIDDYSQVQDIHDKNKTISVKYEDLFNDYDVINSILDFLNLQIKDSSYMYHWSSSKMNNYRHYETIIPNLSDIIKWNGEIND